MGLELDTERMHLRPIESDDLEALLDLDSDPEVMRYLSGGVPSTREFYEQAMPRMLMYRDEPYGYLAALSTEGATVGEFIGWFHLRPSVAEPEILELGYRLKQCFWGLGLATEGSRALLHHAFVTLGHERVDACTVHENLASRRVMEKLGMSCVGDFVHPRGGMEVVRYLVEREAWRAR